MNEDRLIRHLLDRAQGQRVKAETQRDPWCRATALRLAESFENQAERHVRQYLWATRSHENVEAGMYQKGVAWIVREHGGGGWPPRDISRVSGWKVVQLLAHVSNKSVRDVARDVIDQSIAHDE